MLRPLLIAALALSAAPALAQPAATNMGGPLINGVCLLSQSTVLATAKVSVAANQRLQTLKNQAQTEVNSARAPVDADLKQLQADAAKAPAADVEKRRLAIQARYQALQVTADQRNREIEATRTKALLRVASEVKPVIDAAYKAHGCGLLLERDTVLGGNLGGDLTAEVIKGLDAKITSFTFDREVLPPAK